jgi:hypothetical protein
VKAVNSNHDKRLQEIAAAGEPLLRHNTGPFKVDQYLEHLKDLDISEAEKIEFLQTLCLIMKTFVDIGWGLDSIQRIFPALSQSPNAECFNDAAEPNEERD